MLTGRSTSLIIFMLTVLCFGSLASAQAPKRIDIRSVTIEHRVNWDTSIVLIKAVDEDGIELTYGGQANYILNLYECRPCSMPTSFGTNNFNNFQLDFGQDTHGNFSLLTGQSDLLTIPATILRKPATFSRTGAASFQAKFAYSDLHGLLAYDDDVELSGTYTAEFGHVPIYDGHRISFHKIFYDLRQPVN